MQTSTSLEKPPQLGISPTVYHTCTSIVRAAQCLGTALGQESISCSETNQLWDPEEASQPPQPSLGFFICKTGIMTHNSVHCTTTKWENTWEASTVQDTQRHSANGSRHPPPLPPHTPAPLHVLPSKPAANQSGEHRVHASCGFFKSYVYMNLPLCVSSFSALSISLTAASTCRDWDSQSLGYGLLLSIKNKIKQQTNKKTPKAYSNVQPRLKTTTLHDSLQAYH